MQTTIIPNNDHLQKKKSYKFKKTKIAAIVFAGFVVTGSGASAFDLGGFGGLLDTVAPVLSQYTGLDITKYAGYFKTFENVLSAVQGGGMKGILSAVGSINQSLGDSGIVIPSKLVQSTLDVVTAEYTAKGRSTGGSSYIRASDRAIAYAQNLSHRAYVESVLGEEGQKNIKAGVQGSGDLVKSASEIAGKGVKATISQKKFDALLGLGVLNQVGHANTFGKLTEIQINGTQQTEIQSGILEYLTNDKTSKTLSARMNGYGVTQSSGILAGLATPMTDEEKTQQKCTYSCGYDNFYASSPEATITSSTLLTDNLDAGEPNWGTTVPDFDTRSPVISGDRDYIQARNAQEEKK